MISIVNQDSWFLCPNSRPDAELRIFCLPFAGAGASMYREWHNVFPGNIEVRAVQLPGRESRLREPRISDAGVLVKKLVAALHPYLDRPFALLGYSIGALLAFEVVRELRRQGMSLPFHLFVAAMRAPHVPAVHPPIAHLPDDKFIDQINDYYQPSDEAWKIPELRDIIIPVLRDDIMIAESYEYADEPPLPCPIDAYVGAVDRGTPVDSAAAWQDQTSAEFELTIFPDGHFFLRKQLCDLQEKMRISMLSFIGGRR